MLQLRDGEIFETDNGRDAWRIWQGSVQIFLVPEEKGAAARPMYLMDGEAPLTIPGLCCRDDNYITWRFRLKASPDCVLQKVENGNTAVLRRRFAKSAGLGEAEEMSLEHRLIELYDSRIIREDVFISKSEKDRSVVRSETEETVRSVIERTAEPPEDIFDDGTGGTGAAGPAPQDANDPAQGTETGSGKRARPSSQKAPGQQVRRFLKQSPAGLRAAALILGILSLAAAALIGAAGIRAGGVRLEGLFALTGVYLLFRILLEWTLQSAAASTAGQMQRRAYAGVFGLEERFFRVHGRRQAAAAAMEVYDTVRACVLSRSSAVCGCAACIALAAARIIADAAAGTGLRGGASGASAAEAGMRESGFLPPVLWTLLAAAAILTAALILFRNISASAAAESRIGERKRDAEQDVYQFLEQIRRVRLAGAGEHVMNRYFRQVASVKAAGWQLSRRKIPGYLAAAALLAAAFALTVLGAGSLHPAGLQGSILQDPRPELFWNGLIWYGLLSAEAVRAARSAAQMRTEAGILDGILTAIGAQEDPEDREADTAAEPAQSGAAASPQRATEGDPARRAAEDTPQGEEPLLQISGLGFSYGSGDILRDVSLSLQRGETVGLAGASGSGKTTLVRIAAGIEQPDRGTVSIRAAGQAGVMQQDQLISGSILENIEAGHGILPRERLEEILTVTGLAQEIRSMPMGLETMVRDSGGDISAGQRQKILLARALAQDPQLLILDEADTEMQAEELAGLLSYLKRRGCGCLMASHRLENLRQCDRVVLLKDGRIGESGPAGLLLQKNGPFRDLMRHQL